MHLASLAAEAVVAVQAGGGCAVLAVLTVPHQRGDDLATLWRDWLRGAWAWMTHRAAWRSWCAKWGVDDWCAGTECTHSLTSGHHPHDNLVLLLPDRASVDDDALEDMQDELYYLWRDALRAVGCDRYVSPDHGVVLRPVDDAETLGNYVFKHVGLEFSAPSGLKEGRAEGSIECRDLPLWLADYCQGDNVRVVAQRDRQARVRVDAWLEYAEASKGAQVFRASDGFYRWTGAEKMTVDEIRAKAGRLQNEDRARLARALGQEVEAERQTRMTPSDDDEEDDPPLLALDEETFHEAQAAYWAPAERGSGAIVLDLIQSKARRLAFHAAVSAMIRRHGAELTGRMLAASMGRPPGVYTDERGTVVVAYRPHDPGWVQVAA